MKSKNVYTFLSCCILSLFFINQTNGQCCKPPDSLKVKSITDSSFCVQWRVNDSLHCDSAKAYQVQHKLLGSPTWSTTTRLYYATDSIVTFCDTGTLCATYQWRVRNICLHAGDTIITAYVSGPNFTLPCPSPKLASSNAGRLQLHALSVTPNPARNTILITGNYAKALRVDITGMNGKSMFSKTLIPEQGKLSLLVNVGAFNQGIYFITITDDEGATKTNFIRE